MTKGQMKKLLREAIRAVCSDERMREICNVVSVNRQWAVKQLEKLKLRQNSIWSSPKSTPDQIDLASVEHIQCFRMIEMLTGVPVRRRTTVETVRESYSCRVG